MRCAHCRAKVNSYSSNSTHSFAVAHTTSGKEVATARRVVAAINLIFRYIYLISCLPLWKCISVCFGRVWHGLCMYMCVLCVCVCVHGHNNIFKNAALAQGSKKKTPNNNKHNFPFDSCIRQQRNMRVREGTEKHLHFAWSN